MLSVYLFDAGWVSWKNDTYYNGMPFDTYNGFFNEVNDLNDLNAFLPGAFSFHVHKSYLYTPWAEGSTAWLLNSSYMAGCEATMMLEQGSIKNSFRRTLHILNNLFYF